MDINNLKSKLTPEQYNVCFLKGTEPPGGGKYLNNHDIGMYECAVCGQELFASDTKFDTGTGWPSFWEFAKKGAIKETVDSTLGMTRTEVQCSKCASHLGHVFTDGPKALPDGRQATGLRYCINSLALNFVPVKK